MRGEAFTVQHDLCRGEPGAGALLGMKRIGASIGCWIWTSVARVLETGLKGAVAI